ncbi:MAG: penicillin-binding protein 1A [Cellvibrionales bacterium TMED47]|nr:peptidase [Porticoccaceae bacterium]RPG83961.1 MAG: penicillin-binding protein 1A [Cellvibrionales bacterium TMED47]
MKGLITLTIFSVGGFLILASCLFLYLSPKLPSVEELKQVELQIPLKVYSEDLQIIAEFGEKKRSPVNFNQIPPAMVDAFLAAEDDSFFKHGGIVVSGLARAAVELITTGSIRSGGSTITMQVARNFFLSKRQEFTRKFNEILLAFKIEEELSKEEILSLYTNKIYMGNRAYGVGAAAQVYYGKNLDQLTLAEMAMIAGLPKAPSKYNPIANPERALQRRDWILGRMLSLKKISKNDYNAAINEPDNSTYHGSIAKIDAAYAAEMVRQQVIKKYGLKAYTQGYTAITTIDSRLQEKATNSVQFGLIAYDKRHGYRGVQQSAIPEENWQQALKDARSFGDLEPAIVSFVADDHLQIQDIDGQTLPLNWANGLDGLRLFKTASTRSAPIESAHDIFQVGDLIQIQKQDGFVQLAQLPTAQAAMVALSPKEGGIKALVGGFDYRQSRFNRVTQAARQPGSNFKPFIYTVALQNGFTPASTVNDAPVVFDDSKLEDLWRPENDGGKFYGPTRIREALYRSRNLVSIRLLRRMGIDRTLQGLQKFGFETGDMPADLSLSLGSHALTPMTIARGYTIFANGGYLVEPYILDKVIDRDGNIIFEATPDTACDPCIEPLTRDESDTFSAEKIDTELEQLLDTLTQESIPDSEKDHFQLISQTLRNHPKSEVISAKRAIDAPTAFLIDSMLKDVIQKGTGRKAKKLKRNDLGGKTGTTNGPRDAWFSGYSSHLVATAWVGFDDYSQLGRNEYGGSAALPIWIDFMGEALKDKPQTNMPQPMGIVSVKIDPKTGDRVAPNQSGIFEFFTSETVPEPITKGTTPSTGSEPLPEDLF